MGCARWWGRSRLTCGKMNSQILCIFILLCSWPCSIQNSSETTLQIPAGEEKDGGLGSQKYPPPKQFAVTRPDFPGPFATSTFPHSPHEGKIGGYGKEMEGKEMEGTGTEDVPRSKLWSPLSRSARRSGSWSTRIISTTEPTARKRDELDTFRSASFPESAGRGGGGGMVERGGNDGTGTRSLIGNMNKLSWPIHTSSHSEEREREDDVRGRKNGESEQEDDEDDDEDGANELQSWLRSHPSPRQQSQEQGAGVLTSSSPHQPSRGQDGIEEKGRDEEEAAGPIIASIRHHKSRKSFTRTRKGWKGGKSGESTQSVFTLLNEEQADEPHAGNTSPHLYSTSPTFSKKSPFTHHPFPTTQPQNRRPTSSEKESNEHYYGAPTSPDDHPHYMLQAEKDSSGPEEGRGGRKKGMGSKKGLVLPRERENGESNGEDRLGFISSLSATNDSQLVYGQPYFTPNRKRNSTRMQRIKNLLLRNSTEESGKGRVEMIHFPTQDTQHTPDQDSLPSLSSFPLHGESGGRVTGKADGESDILDGKREGGGGGGGFKVSKMGKGSKSREKLRKNNNPGRRKTTAQSSTIFSPTESGAHISPSTTLLPTNNHHNTQQQHQQNFDSTPSGTSQAVPLNGHLARVTPSKSPTPNSTMSGASHGVNPDSLTHPLSPTRPTRPRNKERNHTKEGKKVKAEIMTSRSELTGWDERGNQETSTAGNEQMSSVSSLTLEGAEVWSKEPVSKVPHNSPSEFSEAKRTSGGGLVSSEMFPASVTESGGEEGNGERWSDGRETGGEDDLDNDYTSLAKLEGSTDENGSFLPSTQLSESEMEAEEDVGGSGGEGEVQVTGSPPGGSRARPDMDIVTKFLRIVETQHTLGDNCTAGTAFNLGEGVVDRYAQERFRLEANVAVNRANMLTRLWKYAEMEVMNSEYLLHASLFSMIEFDDDIFAAGNCYDKREYKNYTLFCPFAYRLPEGNILVKDLAVEYKYLSNSSEWFYIARKNAQTVIKNHNQISTGFNTYTYNESTHTDRIDDEILNVTYEDGKWSKPYFDCGGGNIWMMTYTVPFFGFKDGHYYFKGTSGIDIDLRRVDIDQCPLPENSTELNIFAASDKCKNATTKCVPIKGLGFRRGSYRCECQIGFYFPNTSSPLKFFNGTVLEEEYEKKLSNDLTLYDQDGAFECLRCPTGCDSCDDDRPCVVTLNWLMRSAILILQCAIIAMLPIVGLFTWKYSDIKVVRAASPVLLRFIVLGAFFIYCTILVMYPSPSVITCTLRVWLREIGFSLAYGALMLKTWRISVIFRVRSAKAVKITDLDLMKRLGIIVAMFTALLVIRTLVAPPVSIVSLTADDLKAWLCKSDWWDHSFTIMELMFLVWGIRLCIVVRKAPSEFNESKFISLAIYNEFLLSVFLNISMLFLQSPANPDLLYIIFFCHVQLTMTLLLCLIFGSKAYMVFRGHGKGNSSDETRVPTFISKNRSGQKPKQPSGHNSTTGVHSSTTSTSHALEVNFPNNSSRLSEDVQLPELDVVEWVNSAVEEAEREPIPESESETTEEEFRRLYYQLEELKERNMRLGNRHLVAKITAMQEAADNILGGTSGDSGRGGGGGEGGLRREFLDKSASLSQAIDSISMTTMGGSVCVGGATVLSDITEEDSGCGKPPKTKRASFLSRVRSSKRLLSIRSSSGSGAESKTGRGEREGRSVTSGCSSSQGVESGATGSSPAAPPPSSPNKPSSLQGERDSSSNKCVRKLSECDVDGASGGSGGGAKIPDPLRAPPDDEGMAHGGVYIGPSDPPTGPTLPPPTSSHSPFSRPKTEEKEGKEEDEGGSERRGNECEGGSGSSGGSWEREEGVHKLKSTICIHNPLEGGEGEGEDEAQREISSHVVGGEGGKKGEEHVLVGSSGGGTQVKSEKGKRKGRGKGRGEGVNGSSGDSNHASAADGSKIMLDLNDKSRFTEEITV